MSPPGKLLLRAYWVGCVVALPWTGPIVLLGMSAAGGYLLVRTRTSPPAKAGASILLPLAVGLTIVAAAVGVLNAALEYSPTSLNEAQLRGFEDFIHTTATRLPSYLKLPFPIQVLLLCGLYLVALADATGKPVSRFVEGNKWAGRVLASATVVSSFTLFTHDGSLLHEDADRRISAVYTASQERQGEALNRYLSARALNHALRDPETRMYLASLVAESAATSLEDEPATYLSAYVGKKLIVGEAAANVSPRPVDPGATAKEHVEAIFAFPSDPWTPPRRPPQQVDTGVVVPADATAFIGGQRARERHTADRAGAEERKAIETILTGAVDASTSRVNKIAETLVRSLIENQGEFFADQTVTYLTKVLDKSFDTLIEPLAARGASRLQLRIRQALRPDRSVSEAARTSTIDGLTDLTVRIPAEYLRLAGEQAKAYLKYSFLTIQHNFPEVLRARLYSTKARALLSSFGPASPDGAIDMRPVSALLERVMPDVTRVLENEASRERFEREVATIRREVEAGARRGGRRAR